jgi:hypothetical protein
VDNNRLQQGQKLANEPNQIVRIDERSYKVKSQSNNDNEYDVIVGESGWICSCPDCMFRGVTCKHIHAVEISYELRKKVSSQIVIEPITINICPQCKFDQIVKHGIRHNKEIFNATHVTTDTNGLQPTWVLRKCMQHLKLSFLRCSCISLASRLEMSRSF